MTQDDIIEWALEANIGDATIEYYKEELEVFAKLIAAQVEEALAEEYMTDIHRAIKIEREACAKECEHTALRMGSEWMAAHCAEAIRSRGKP
jgi:hypothetical protein